MPLQQTTACTTADSHKDASPKTSSTVPERWRPNEPHLSAHPGGPSLGCGCAAAVVAMIVVPFWQAAGLEGERVPDC